MQILIQIAVSIVATIAFDWGLHFQTQLFEGVATDGRRPGRYNWPGPIRILLMTLYLVPLNVMIYYRMRDINVWWVILLVTLPIYALYSYGEGLKSMNRTPDDY